MSTAVHDVMTTRVISVPETAEYKEIVTLLRRHGVSAVPVIDQAGKVTGLVSEADLLMKQTAPAMPSGAVRLAWRLRLKSKASAVTAAELMTSPAVTIGPDASVGQAACLMRDRRVKRLPVVDGGQLVGIVSRVDVLSVYERPDDEIRHEIVAGIVVGSLLDPSAFEVTVKSGIVTMSGQAESRVVALNLLSAVLCVEGVVAVRDHLSYPAARAR